MTTLREAEFKNAEEYVRSLVRSDPHMSIDDIARLTSDNCIRGLRKGRISALRHAVRQEYQLPSKNILPDDDSPSLPPPPKLITVETNMTPEIAPTPTSMPTETDREREERLRQEKRRFCDDYILKNFPNVTVNKVRDAIKHEFIDTGRDAEGLGTDYIRQSILAAKTAYDESHPIKRPVQDIGPKDRIVETPKELAQPAPNALQNALAALKASGLTPKEIVFEADGTFRFKL